MGGEGGGGGGGGGGGVPEEREIERQSTTKITYLRGPPHARRREAGLEIRHFPP